MAVRPSAENLSIAIYSLASRKFLGDSRKTLDDRNP
jgi:hypothetical protein